MRLLQEQGTFTGWPLGLEIMSTRLQVTENQRPAPTIEVEPYSINMPSFSFSSVTSSNLDTEVIYFSRITIYKTLQFHFILFCIYTTFKNYFSQGFRFKKKKFFHLIKWEILCYILKVLCAFSKLLEMFFKKYCLFQHKLLKILSPNIL